jgi:hypothetical protein
VQVQFVLVATDAYHAMALVFRLGIGRLSTNLPELPMERAERSLGRALIDHMTQSDTPKGTWRVGHTKSQEPKPDSLFEVVVVAKDRLYQALDFSPFSSKC